MSKKSLKKIKIGFKSPPSIMKNPLPTQEESDKVVDAIRRKNQETEGLAQIVSNISIDSKKEEKAKPKASKKYVQIEVTEDIHIALTVAVLKTGAKSKTDYLFPIVESHLRKEGYL